MFILLETQLIPTKPSKDIFTDIHVWVFDLDNTLYPRSAGIVEETGRRMRGWLRSRFRLDEKEAHRMQRKYFLSHGSTLAGLVHHHGIAAEDYLEHVYDVDLSRIAPDSTLADAVAGLPGRGLVFTNASSRHAERVLGRLGIGKGIDGIFSITDANLVGKPDPEAYDLLAAKHGIEPREAAFFEDIPRNLLPAAALGMRTVWIRNELPDFLMGGASEEDFDHVTDDLAGLLGRIAGGEG